jgi:hypothetical protein
MERKLLYSNRSNMPVRAPVEPREHLLIESLSLFNDFFSAGDLLSKVGARKRMSLALERTLAPAVGWPESPAFEEQESKLNIAVIFTAVEPILAALKHAGVLARNLGARLSLVVPQVVPYPMPLHSPPVPLDFNERRVRVIAGQSRVETNVPVLLCRDRLETLKATLKPHSLVVVGGRKTWWPTAEKKLAKKLRRAGHEVIFSEIERGEKCSIYSTSL